MKNTEKTTLSHKDKRKDESTKLEKSNKIIESSIKVSAKEILRAGSNLALPPIEKEKASEDFVFVANSKEDFAIISKNPKETEDFEVINKKEVDEELQKWTKRISSEDKNQQKHR